jgi:hypothetical protein
MAGVANGTYILDSEQRSGRTLRITACGTDNAIEAVLTDIQQTKSLPSRGGSLSASKSTCSESSMSAPFAKASINLAAAQTEPVVSAHTSSRFALSRVWWMQEIRI